MTLAILTLPVVIVTTEEALRAVPRELREAGQALGASKAQTIFRVVVPAARSGILTGAILAVSRGAGEVAAILFTGVYPASLADFGKGVFRWETRVAAYLLLLRDEYPPFSLNA